MSKISLYHAVYINQIYKFVENDSIRMTFVIFDERGSLLTNAQLSEFKYKFWLHYNTDDIKKKSVGYDGGSADQIEISGNKIIIKIDKDETDGYAGDYAVEFEAQKTDDSERYTIYSGEIEIQKEIVDF